MPTHQININFSGECTKDPGYEDEEDLEFTCQSGWYGILCGPGHSSPLKSSLLNYCSALEAPSGRATGGAWDRARERPEPGTRAEEMAWSQGK